MALVMIGPGKYAGDAAADLIHGFASGSAALRYDTFDNEAGSGVQVTAGKTLVITDLIFSMNAAGYSFALGYGDDVVSDAAGAPTNAVTGKQMFAEDVAYKTWSLKVHIEIPAEKYPFIYVAGGAGQVHFIGYEK